MSDPALASGHGCDDTSLLPQEPLFRDRVAVSRNMHMAIIWSCPYAVPADIYSVGVFIRVVPNIVVIRQ